MPQRPMPFFEQREEDLLSTLLLERAERDQAREGKCTRVLEFWLGRGVQVQFAALLIIQPADEMGATGHRSLTKLVHRHLAKLNGAPLEEVQAVTRRTKP